MSTEGETALPRTMLHRITDAVQWIVGVGAATAVVMLFTLDNAPPGPQPQVVSAEALYAQHCASCHGIDGSGGQGPRLAGTMEELYPDPADQAAYIRAGSTGMPAFADVLSGEELDRIVHYTRNVLG
ncbi:MAG: cytochrome c [Acidimicrobiales bacterium]|nr:cytochrome c [Acidimicrobiales bacterium]